MSKKVKQKEPFNQKFKVQPKIEPRVLEPNPKLNQRFKAAPIVESQFNQKFEAPIKNEPSVQSRKSPTNYHIHRLIRSVSAEYAFLLNRLLGYYSARVGSTMIHVVFIFGLQLCGPRGGGKDISARESKCYDQI